MAVSSVSYCVCYYGYMMYIRYFDEKLKRNLLVVSIALAVLLAPTFTFAVARDVLGVIDIFGKILGTIGPIIVALALVYFFWGVSKFILHADDETKRSEGRQIMIWGIIALFVIVSVWGLVAVLNNTFVGRGTAPSAPGLPGTGRSAPSPSSPAPSFDPSFSI